MASFLKPPDIWEKTEHSNKPQFKKKKLVVDDHEKEHLYEMPPNLQENFIDCMFQKIAKMNFIEFDLPYSYYVEKKLCKALQ